jgi:transmembrane sensor
MSDHTPWPLIAKYLAGECSQEEKLVMEWWLEDYHNNQLYQQIKTAWQQEREPKDVPEFDPEHALSRLHARIAENDTTGTDRAETQVRYRRLRFWMAAASVIILTGIAYLFVNKEIGKKSESLVNLGETIRSEDEVISFALPDGSQVWLNKKSRLDYPKAFTSDRREVFLEGEAFFEVVPNPEKPFIVKSRKVSTRVLGTSFNVRVNKSEETASVAVATGKVEVSKETASGTPIRITQLTPQQELVINTKKDETYIDIVSLTDVGSWRREQLVFRNNTYAEVITRLESHYGIKVNLRDTSLRDCRVMASFGEDASLRDVLKLLSISNSFRYNIDGNQVTILGGTCK